MKRRAIATALAVSGVSLVGATAAHTSAPLRQPATHLGADAGRATVPSAPTGLVAQFLDHDARVVLIWTVPAADGGSPITGYDVYRGTHSGGESVTPLASNLTATSFTDTDLVNGTTYYYTVAAVNTVGVSPQSAEAASATPQQTAPSAPQSLAATGGSGSVSLTWKPPASNGGATVTGYIVYQGISPGGEDATPLASNVTATRFTHRGLVKGTTYYFTIRAVNAVGVSPPSNEATATPRAGPARTGGPSRTYVYRDGRRLGYVSFDGLTYCASFRDCDEDWVYSMNANAYVYGWESWRPCDHCCSVATPRTSRYWVVKEWGRPWKPIGALIWLRSNVWQARNASGRTLGRAEGPHGLPAALFLIACS